MSPTVPNQLPKIFALYSASSTGLAGVQAEMQKANASIKPSTGRNGMLIKRREWGWKISEEFFRLIMSVSF
jgi:hypothetical protein